MVKVKKLMKGQCPGHLRQVKRGNPGYVANYFSKKCPDPFTALSYWRRRFPNGQNEYLGGMWMPHKYNRNTFGTNKWYGKKLNLGEINHLLHKVSKN